MLDKVTEELWDLGVTVSSIFEKTGYYFILQIEKDGKVRRRTISYADIFYAPGVPSLEGTLSRYLSEVLYCIKNGRKLPEEWTLDGVAYEYTISLVEE